MGMEKYIWTVSFAGPSPGCGVRRLIEAEHMSRLDNRLRPLFNVGEAKTYAIAEAVGRATGTKAFAKVRLADVFTIANTGISNDLYRYALSAHFDVLVYKDNLPYLAIEFDGGGHDSRSDEKKNELCNLFALPMVRVGPHHIDASVFEDTAVAFFIWQLHCVDMFLETYGNDPYEKYDPIFFISVQGKARSWPFAYRERWLGRLTKHFQKSAERFEGDLRLSYSYGLLQFNASFGTWNRSGQFRSIVAQKVTEDGVVWGEAELSLKVSGLSESRVEPFHEVSTFVLGMVAERMYGHAMRFIDDNASPTKMDFITHRIRQWEAEGFDLRLAANLNWRE